MQAFQPKLILVPTDFSEPAAHALRYASALGERFAAHLLVIYADDFMPPVDFTATTAGEFAISREEMIADARERLEVHVETNISTSVPYDTRVVIGAPVNAILEQARECGADLLVMGTHGRSGMARLVIGSVTEAVVRLATIPVITVNAATRENAEVKKALCPVSYDAASRQALRYAASLATSRKTPLVLLRGIEEQQITATIDELIRLQDWAPRELVDRCELKVFPARIPAEQVVKFARQIDADLIAVGGSRIAPQIVRNAPCPVLVINDSAVPEPQRERELVAAK